MEHNKTTSVNLKISKCFSNFSFSSVSFFVSSPIDLNVQPIFSTSEFFTFGSIILCHNSTVPSVRQVETKKKKSTKKEEGGAAPKKPAARSGSNVFSAFTQHQVQEFKEAFQFIDQDKDGFISKGDISKTFDALGRMCTSAELEDMVSEAPGPINFTMFLTIFGK